MSQHRLISAHAALLGTAAAAAAPPATTLTPAAPAPAPGAAAPAADVPVDVVTLADAQAAVAAAENRGATAERSRTAAVMASAEGRANPQMAAFMLNSNPGASSDDIVAHLKTMPAGAAASTVAPAAAAPAAPAAAAPTAPAAPAAPTADLNQTPLINVGADANEGDAGGMSAADQTKFWETAMTGAGATASPFGAPLAGGIPRTGN